MRDMQRAVKGFENKIYNATMVGENVQKQSALDLKVRLANLGKLDTKLSAELDRLGSLSNAEKRRGIMQGKYFKMNFKGNDMLLDQYAMMRLAALGLSEVNFIPQYESNLKIQKDQLDLMDEAMQAGAAYAKWTIGDWDADDLSPAKKKYMEVVKKMKRAGIKLNVPKLTSEQMDPGQVGKAKKFHQEQSVRINQAVTELRRKQGDLVGGLEKNLEEARAMIRKEDALTRAMDALQKAKEEREAKRKAAEDHMKKVNKAIQDRIKLMEKLRKEHEKVMALDKDMMAIEFKHKVKDIKKVFATEMSLRKGNAKVRLQLETQLSEALRLQFEIDAYSRLKGLKKQNEALAHANKLAAANDLDKIKIEGEKKKDEAEKEFKKLEELEKLYKEEAFNQEKERYKAAQNLAKKQFKRGRKRQKALRQAEEEHRIEMGVINHAANKAKTEREEAQANRELNITEETQRKLKELQEKYTDQTEKIEREANEHHLNELEKNLIRIKKEKEEAEKDGSQSSEDIRNRELAELKLHSAKSKKIVEDLHKDLYGDEDEPLYIAGLGSSDELRGLYQEFTEVEGVNKRERIAKEIAFWERIKSVRNTYAQQMAAAEGLDDADKKIAQDAHKLQMEVELQKIYDERYKLLIRETKAFKIFSAIVLTFHKSTFLFWETFLDIKGWKKVAEGIYSAANSAAVWVAELYLVKDILTSISESLETDSIAKAILGGIVKGAIDALIVKPLKKLKEIGSSIISFFGEGFGDRLVEGISQIPLYISAVSAEFKMLIKNIGNLKISDVVEFFKKFKNVGLAAFGLLKISLKSIWVLGEKIASGLMKLFSFMTGGLSLNPFKIITDGATDFLNAQEDIKERQKELDEQLSKGEITQAEYAAGSKSLQAESDPAVAAQKFVETLINNAANMVKAVATHAPLILQELTAQLPILTQALVESIPQLFDGLKNNLPDFIRALIDLLKKVIPVIIKTLIITLPDLIRGFIEVIKANLPMFLHMITQLAFLLIRALINALPTIMSAVLDMLPTLIDAFTKLVVALIDALPELITQLVEALPDVIVQLLGSIGDIIAAIMDALPDILDAILENLPDILEALIEGLMLIITKIVEALPSFLQKLMQVLPKFWPAILMAVTQAIVMFVEMLPDLINAVIEALPFIVQALIQHVPMVVLELIKAIPLIVGALLTALFSQELWDGLIAAAKTFISAVWEGITEAFKTIGKTIATIFEDAFDEIKGFFTGDNPETATFGDTPYAIRAGTAGLAARFAAGDYVIAAQRPVDLLKQSIDAFSNTQTGSFRGNNSATQNIDIAVIAEGRLLDAIQVKAMNKGHAPKMENKFRRASGVNIGFNRGRFNKYTAS